MTFESVTRWLVACWVINVGVAEWIIRRPANGRQVADADLPSPRTWAVAP